MKLVVLLGFLSSQKIGGQLGSSLVPLKEKKHQGHKEALDFKKNKSLFDFFNKSSKKNENNPNSPETLVLRFVRRQCLVAVSPLFKEIQTKTPAQM